MLQKILITTLISLSAATSVFAAEAKVAFDSNVKVFVLTKDGLTNDQAFDAGKEIPLKPDTVYWVQSAGKVPLLVVPQSPVESGAPSKLQLPDVTTWPSEIASQQLQTKLALVIDDLYQFQMALSRKDTAEAEKVLSRMEDVQPMEYYSFLRASVAFMKGDLKVAKEQVQRGLKRYPANEQGSRLLKTIEGASK